MRSLKLIPHELNSKTPEYSPAKKSLNYLAVVAKENPSYSSYLRPSYLATALRNQDTGMPTSQRISPTCQSNEAQETSKKDDGPVSCDQGSLPCLEEAPVLTRESEVDDSSPAQANTEPPLISPQEKSRPSATAEEETPKGSQEGEKTGTSSGDGGQNGQLLSQGYS
ncbi:hypothetical protein BSL78_24065 [Apostichopus japonicus]|uniref:Uncharacterized protein n=1 Tax=Stichopus japonicus TaxID=307972 RepID=A0A2G8JTK4_STIJA|nr:hypothetical protein BSL78_24065 [Apostichopus japonicus]